ncbi:MAG: hypothetical protein QOI06_2195 [Nocardioidaceae bacterium]|jgi:hypothetical protein|nr:hypothetical protein [Nocardioidaceae bacterium]
MTDVGDNAPAPPRRPLANSPGAAATPTQEIPRPSDDSGKQTFEETGKTLPVPPGGLPVVSDTERAKAEKADRARKKAAVKAARRAASRRPRQTRRAKLRLSRVDPWSVTKTAFLLSIAFGVMCVVAVFLVFSIMSASGLWDQVNSTIQSVVNQDPSSQFNIKDYVATSRVMGITMLISVVDVVLITALATLGAFIYNMSAAMLGGIEVTLAEDLD